MRDKKEKIAIRNKNITAGDRHRDCRQEDSYHAPKVDSSGEGVRSFAFCRVECDSSTN